MDPRWTCEACGRVSRIYGENISDQTRAKDKLFEICRRAGHKYKPYYTAGVRL